MSTLLSARLALGALLGLSLGAQAAPSHLDDQTQLPKAPTKGGSPYFQPPQIGELPNNAFGEMVRRGEALFVNTKALAPQYVGNEMNCVNCHLDRGRKANSAPLWAAYGMYPAYRKKNNKVNTFVERMQGCFQFSMNGKPPAADSEVLTALTAYAYWTATGAPVGKALPGRGFDEPPPPKGGYSLVRGEAVYKGQCALCHGDNGQGQKVGASYVFPPLWGKDSYNWGAGMHRINTAAGFIQHNMPLGKGETLSDQEAWDVAAFVNMHERPQDPRLINGDIEATRKRFHEGDGVNLYGTRVNGVLIGQGVKP
ncbi:c-type cytochrome [Azospira inquinata]|uniref:C-type cytochrome n=1 Tax=Azospira inquinata TaxID=2785627 RepID=A0A975XVV7_9RHOO|nr:c-type cytochrome [Azospira inquinata]QWT47119.1 c-type cytochrome [Azospira inquinata]QWT50252.1 c-type cytochrome [Azospira inquinata]